MSLGELHREGGKNKQHTLQSHFILRMVSCQEALKCGDKQRGMLFLSRECGLAVRAEDSHQQTVQGFWHPPLQPPPSSLLHSCSLLLRDINFLYDSHLRPDLIPGHFAFQ